MLALGYSQHGVHASVHFANAGEGMIASRTETDAAARNPSVVQLAGVTEAQVDIPKFCRDRLPRLREDCVRIDEPIAHPACHTPSVQRVDPQRVGEREVLPDHLKVGRLALHGNAGTPNSAVSYRVHGMHTASQTSHSAPVPESHVT